MKKVSNPQTKSTPKKAGNPTIELTVVCSGIEQRPDFLTWTPQDNNFYTLTMFKDGDSEQNIEISRDEFIKLKVEIARLRGYEIPDPLTDEFLSSIEYRCRPAAA